MTDEELYNKHRIAMQKAYLEARVDIGGISTWDHRDTVYLDCIDGQLKNSFAKENKEVPIKPNLTNLIKQIEEDFTQPFPIKPRRFEKALDAAGFKTDAA